MKEAIEELEKMRQTHIGWIKYLKNHPEYPTRDCGDILHHELVIKKYDKIIETCKQYL